MSLDLSALQHEREHSKPKAWIEHWGTINSEPAKVNFLMMLKSRRDNYRDQEAGGVLNYLVELWLGEEYIP